MSQFPDIYTSHRLLGTTVHAAAIQLVSDERAHMSAIYGASPAAKSAFEAATQYLNYFLSTWLPLPLWQSWSDFGRLIASALLKIPIAGVLPTTNHLESFNRLLKRKYIPLWQRSGSRLRFDFLISILITNILPEIFANRQAQQDYSNWLLKRFSSTSNSTNIAAALELRQHPNRAVGPKLCWWREDRQRGSDAQDLLRRNCLHDITMHAGGGGYEASCSSSSRAGAVYSLQLQREGYASCDCPDFLHRGGACKHLRAFRLVVDGWVDRGIITAFNYPASLMAAARVHPTPLPPIGNPLSTPVHPASTNVGTSTVDNILTLQMMALQSGPSEELQDDLEDDVDFISDIRSDQSDHSSESSASAAEFLKFVRLVSVSLHA